MEETIDHMKSEDSHKVIAQGLMTLLHLGRNIPSLHVRLVQTAKQVEQTDIISLFYETIVNQKHFSLLVFERYK